MHLVITLAVVASWLANSPEAPVKLPKPNPKLKKMENQNKKVVNIEETPMETDNQEEGENHILPPEDIPDEFQCCVCLDLLYKPVVLACGHTSCFWCVYGSMNYVHHSNCPICRCPFNHFPSICQILHFLLLKLYPIAYKRRESQVQEEEKKSGHFSPQLDQFLIEQRSENSDILESNGSFAQECLHSESCSKDGESSLVRDSPKMATVVENVVRSLKDAAHAPDLGNNFEFVEPTKVSITDLLCVACKRLLFRPVVLNCGHVYCESCFIISKDEIPRCQVCQSLHPNGFPNVCLILDHFLEEQFPDKYSERRGAMHKENNGSTQAQRHANRAKSISTDVYSSWFSGNGPKVHIGVGCDYCGMSPIIGERYKCKDCMEKIGFDLCESCFKAPVKIPGRFNQQHKADHQFEIILPMSLSDFIFRRSSEHSDDEGSDAPEHSDDVAQTPTLTDFVSRLNSEHSDDEASGSYAHATSHTSLAEGDGAEEPEDNSPSLILSLDVSLYQEDESDDPSDNVSTTQAKE